jgi:glycosyltransferase involved in cell wall biosynthesis
MSDTDAAQRRLAELEAENARLRLLAEQSAASAALQGMRAGGQGGHAHAMSLQVLAMRASFFWRLTLPLRLAADLARGVPPGSGQEALFLRRLAGVARTRGLRAAITQGRAQLRRREAVRAELAAQRNAVLPMGTASPDGAATALPDPCAILAPSVLIVAELTLQQCAKYRVWQKQEHFARLGIPCRVMDWNRREECLSAATLATMVIMYRVPGYPGVLDMIAAMHALRLPIWWEVDDLIFDAALFLQNRNVESLDREMREGVLSGVDLYRASMLAAGSGIASTPRLADVMGDAGLADVAVVENALDGETLSVAANLRHARDAAPPHAGVLITYGSGTKTHDADFRQAAPGLLRLLQARPDVRLRIVGELRLPDGFDAVAGQVERLPPVPFARYLALLAESDIAVAPLEPTIFNDAKSNIKFLEAAILGLPSVCSPRAHFTDVIHDGENGMLAEGDDAWFAALARLADDAGLRARMGAAALRTALERYAPEAVAQMQVAPLLRRAPDRRPAGKLRVLFANIYYAPRSYGGATLVVEQMARRLHARGDTDVHIFTGLPPSDETGVVTRTNQDGVTVFAVPTSEGDSVALFDDPAVTEAFGDVLDAVRPAVVHLHAIQGLGAGLATACLQRGIPYVITLHDAWWLCARQFMVREDGKYCFQTTIDLHICQNCVPGAYHLEARARLMQAALRGAALLISPSAAHRTLHIANGVDPDRIVVAPNGVRLPATPPARMPGKVLRFAYVGGNVEVKGFSVVKRAFEALDRDDWELVLVDNTLNLGFSTMNAAEWSVRGTLRIVPAYTQDAMDAFFEETDVLVFPSQWKESFGLTVREALARGVWVITTDGGGPAEAIEDGRNGTLIPLDGRHEPLLAALGALLDDPGRLHRGSQTQNDTIMDYAAQAQTLHGLLTRVVTGDKHAA